MKDCLLKPHRMPVRPRILVCLLTSLFLSNLHAQSPDRAGPFRTQTLQLEAGWNAVYLEIEPLEAVPSELFKGTPIQIAAAYYRPVTPMEFIDSPDAVLPDRKGWSVWYAPERADALLSDLYRVQAHQAYLLFTEEAFTWELRGSAYFGFTQWHPHAYSLVGFPIDANERPTVANFFSGAEAHTPLRIYRLAQGSWARITNPEQVLMKPGEAYWAYSDGASNYRGPLTVDFRGSSAGGIYFDTGGTSRALTIRNVSGFPQNLTLTLDSGTGVSLPLKYLVRSLNQPEGSIATVSVPFPETMELGPLEAGQAFALDLQVGAEAMSTALATATLNISTDAGLLLEVPIVFVRQDLLN